MKNLYLFSIVFLLSFNSYSQSYTPFPDSGAVWVNSYYGESDDYIGVFMWELYNVWNYCVNGNDTLINSINYIKLEICVTDEYYGALRDDNGKVYFVPVDSTNEFLIYDFTVEEGDIIPEVWYKVDFSSEIYSVGTNILVSNIDSILIGSEYRKTVYLDLDYADGSFWIEGIGNSKGLLRGLWENLNLSSFHLDIECMSVNDTTYYPHYAQKKCFIGLDIEEKEEMNVEIYPNPITDGFVKISFTNINEPLNYYITNLNGQIVSEGFVTNQAIELDLPSGFYLLNINTQKSKTVKKIIVY